MQKIVIFHNLWSALILTGISQSSEIFTVDRSLTDVSSMKISALYVVYFGQESLLKSGFFMKKGFTEGFFSLDTRPMEVGVR
jgi:hypothetical protein